MRRVYTIGETIFDIILKNGKIHTAKACGSMLNSSVSLARLGIDIHFISEIGADEVGELIVRFLNENHVSTEYIYRFKNGKTPIALAFLDERQNAAYSFYKIYPVKRLQQAFPTITDQDIVLFGSFYSLSAEVREPVAMFLKGAEDAGAIIIYDPNIRKPHQKEIPELQNLIFENISFSDIMRGSDDDFKVIFGVNHSSEVYKIVKDNGCQNLIFTAGGEYVHLHTNQFSKVFSVPGIIPKSTIGAGDNFNAGIIYSIIRQNIFKKDLLYHDSAQWSEILNTGIELSQEVCKSYDNYISTAFAKRLLNRK